MKHLNKYLLVAFAFILVIASCSIEKRQHMAGYHIEWKERNRTTVAVKDKKVLPATTAAAEDKAKPASSAAIVLSDDAAAENPVIAENTVASNAAEQVIIPQNQFKTSSSNSNPSTQNLKPILRKAIKAHKAKAKANGGETNIMAILSLVLGALSLILLFIPGVGLIGLLFALLAIVFGAVAISGINHNGGEGRGMAIAGIILGAAVLLLFLLLIVLLAAFISSI